MSRQRANYLNLLFLAEFGWRHRGGQRRPRRVHAIAVPVGTKSPPKQMQGDPVFAVDRALPCHPPLTPTLIWAKASSHPDNDKKYHHDYGRRANNSLQ